MRRLLSSPALLPAAAALAAVLLALPYLPWAGPKTSAAWRGYHVLLLRGAAAQQAKALEALASAFPGAVSEATALVSYSDFVGSASSTLEQLPSRLDPADPRFDRYLRGLAGYFAVGGRPGMRAVFLPATRTGGATARRAGRALGAGAGFRLVGHDPLVKAIVLCWAFALALAASLSARRGPAVGSLTPLLLAPACVLCWTPFLLSGTIADMCFVGSIFPAWVRLAAAGRGPGRFTPRGGAAKGTAGPAADFAAAVAFGLAALLLLAGFSWFRLAGALAGTACSLLLLPARPVLARLVRFLLGRRAFPAPLSLRRPAAALRAPVALLSISAIPLLLAVAVLLRAPALPTPFPVAGLRDFSWRSLSALADAVSGSPQTALPDIAGSVTHEVFQQALVFGSPWGLPNAETRVAVAEYVEDPSTGKTTERKRTVKILDGAWLNALIRSPLSPSVEQLLLSQGRPVRVRVARNLPGLVRDLAAAILCAAALLGWGRAGGGVRHLIRARIWRFTPTSTRSKHPR